MKGKAFVVMLYQKRPEQIYLIGLHCNTCPEQKLKEAFGWKHLDTEVGLNVELTNFNMDIN